MERTGGHMQYPRMKKGTRRRLAVEALDGGLDVSLPADRIGDNALSGCRNLWWKEGALRTRPGIRALPDTLTAADASQSDVFAAADAVDTVQEDYGSRSVPVRRFLRRKDTGSGVQASVGTLGYDGTMEIPAGVITGCGARSLTFDYQAAATEWGVDTDGVLVLDASKRLLARKADGSGYIDLESRLYAPLLLKDGRGVANYGEPPVMEGTNPETPNMLTGWFRAQYTTDDTSSTFFLPLKGLDDTTVTATYVNSQGYTFTHTLQPGEVRSEVGDDGLCINCMRAWGCLYFVDGESGMPKALGAVGMENNLTITACKTDAALQDLVYGMGFCTWFGGDRSARSGGARLYLAGNPASPGTICWSAPGNPLYVPADNRALVGDAGQAVRAFGRQGDKLLIFKDREVLGASYAAADTASAGFPLTQIHTGIGCGLPATVALCGSQLVWAFDKKVYTYESGKVRQLSEPVERLLAAVSDEDWNAASAAPYAGGWLLLAGQTLFYLDLAGKQPAWYVWDAADTGLTLERVLACGTQGVLLASAALNGQSYRLLARLEGEEDETLQWTQEGTVTVPVPIASAFATGLSDFGRPEQRKTVHRVALELAGAGAARARFYTLSEWGKRADCSGWLPAAWESGLVLERPLPAGAVRVRRYGLAVETEGPVAVGGFLAEATVLG